MLLSACERSPQSIQKEVVAVLNKKAYKTDVHRSLKTKADAQVTADALSRKPDAIEIKEALAQKLDKTACQRGKFFSMMLCGGWTVAC